jgi:transcriptional regulator with XRE-family HTH domain
MKKNEENQEFPELDLISNRLKEIRKEKGYSNYEHIAFELGMSRSAYWRLENGANFNLKTLIKVLRLLNVSLEDFFKEIKTPSHK